ncbi:MAG TPA: secretin N-terminal domain-containing protein [bacterium]|jgi:type II secretory pathway component GspD/PulD (secretin)|nr:secretin N-terminal domain-containing protein [bacterium]
MRAASVFLSIVVAATALLAPSLPAHAATVSVTALTVKQFPGKEQLAVAATGPLTYTLANRRNPLRVELRLEGATLAAPVETAGIDVIKSARAEPRNGAVEVTILLRREAPYDVTYAGNRSVLVLGFATGAVAGATQRFTLEFRNAEIVDVFRTLSELANVNIVVGADVQGRVTMRLVDVTFEEALRLILEANRLGALRIGRSVVVMPLERLPAPDAVGKTYRLQHANATDVATMINTLQQQAVGGRPGQAAGQRGLAVADPDTNSVFVVAPPEDQVIIEQLIASVDLPVPLRVVKLNFLDAKPTADLLREMLAKEGAIVIKEDIRANALVLAGPESLLRRAQGLLAELDVALPQVMIEARVVELNKGASRELGLTSLVQVRPPAIIIPPVGDILFEIAAGTLEAFLRRLQLLINENKGRVLAAPRIATLDGHEAVITVGKTISVPVVGPQGTVGVQEINAGITLAITPRVNTDGLITARINPQVRSISEIRAEGFVIAERSADTTLTVRDGTSIVIGGLITTEELETMTRIPLLSDIPILGELFKFRRREVRESEVIIIITPRILTRMAPAP